MKRFFLAIMLFTLAYSGFTQTKSGEERRRGERLFINEGMEVNSPVEAAKIFQRGIYLENADSLHKAFIAYRLVFYFDSTATIAAKARSKLDSITQLYPGKLRKQLLGSWRWIGSGSNWGASDDPGKCKCEKSVVFDNTNVYFLEGNEVKSSYEYHLKPYSAGYRWIIYYIIDVPGLNEKWTTGFGNRWWPIASPYSLTINRMYGCVCGCPEEYYEKINYY